MAEREEIPWHERSAPGRVSPRQCVRNAQECMTRAWGRDTAWRACYDIRDSVDWLRRALEQMAPDDAEPAPSPVQEARAS